MSQTYLFPVSSGEFAGKRVLVNAEMPVKA
jgi:hypothetical protein